MPWVRPQKCRRIASIMPAPRQHAASRRRQQRHEFNSHACQAQQQQRSTPRHQLTLHDVVCNDLAYALRQMDSLENVALEAAQRNPTNKEDCAGSLSEIRHNLTEVLQYTRTAITTLQSSDDESYGTGRNGDSTDKTTLNITALLNQEQKKLNHTGISGIIAAPDMEKVEMPRDTAAIIEGLIREIFGNLLKYADPAKRGGCSYCEERRHHPAYQHQRFASPGLQTEHPAKHFTNLIGCPVNIIDRIVYRYDERLIGSTASWRYGHTLISNTTRGIRRRIIHLRFRRPVDAGSRHTFNVFIIVGLRSFLL